MLDREFDEDWFYVRGMRNPKHSLPTANVNHSYSDEDLVPRWSPHFNWALWQWRRYHSYAWRHYHQKDDPFAQSR